MIKKILSEIDNYLIKLTKWAVYGFLVLVSIVSMGLLLFGVPLGIAVYGFRGDFKFVSVLILVGIASFYIIRVIPTVATKINPDEVQDNIGKDELEDAAEEVAKIRGKISPETLKHDLGIGYIRAVGLIDILENKGIISGEDGSKPRIYLKTGNTDKQTKL